MRSSRGSILARLVLIAVLLTPAISRSERTLPFPAEFAERVEETFFDDGAVSPERVEAYRDAIDDRRDELVEIYEADYRDKGRSSESAKKRARGKKRVEVYDLLKDDGGWLDALLAEPDPVRARILAGRILEVDYALKVEGEPPLSRRLVDYIPAITVQSWSVPAETRPEDAELEATNLYDPATGLFYDADDLRAMAKRGVDLSALDPPPDSTFWRNPGAIALRDVEESFYGGGDPVHAGLRQEFPSEARLDEVKRSQTKPKFDLEVDVEGEKRSYKLKVGAEIHSEPTLGALMATLGLNTDVTHHVKNFRIDLGDADLDDVRDEWRSYFENHRIHLRFRFDDFFEVGEDERGRYMIAKEGLLEAKPPEIVRVGPWPFGENGNQGYREVRGLAIFSIWISNTDLKEAENNKLVLRRAEDGEVETFHVQHDLGHSFGRLLSEQLNAYPWDILEWTPRDRIQFNYHSAQKTSLRKRVTYADARWMARLIAQLTREQIETAVRIGRWPDAVARLLVEKLIYRRNQLVEAFELVGEQTPSGPIRLLDVDRYLTTEDGAVVDGELVTGRFHGATKVFSDYYEELLGPVWDRAALIGVGLFQGSVGQVAELVLDPSQFDIPEYLVVEIILNFNRVVVENPRPTGEDDYYIARDDFIVGLRLGAGFVAEGVVTAWRRYSLLQPAGTRREGHYAGGTLLNVGLPFQLREHKLPDRYVLVRETYLDAGARLITDRLGGPGVIPGVELSVVRARLSRNVLARSGDTLKAYEDLQHFTEEGGRLFLSVYVLRFPLASGSGRQGTLGGRLFVLDAPRTGRREEVDDAVSRLIRRGDFSGVEAIAPGLEVDSDFSEWRSRSVLAWFAGAFRSARIDDVVVRPMTPGAPSRRFVQVRDQGGRFWNVLDFGELHRYRVRTVAPVEARTGRPKRSVVEVTFFARDQNTESHELEEGFLHLANGIRKFEDGSAGHGLIEFTPSAHSVNGRWGHTSSRVDVGFSRNAVKRLLALEPEVYWDELTETLGVTRAELDRDLRRLDVRGKLRWQARRKLEPGLRRTLLHSRQLLAKVADARHADDPDEAIRAPVDALRAAIYRRRQGYDPRILATLRRLLGKDEVSVSARLTQPAWIEKRLLGEVDLVGNTHKEPHRSKTRQIEFRPTGTLEFYRMLDTFPDPREELGVVE